jgi:hypothetical protein
MSVFCFEKAGTTAKSDHVAKKYLARVPSVSENKQEPSREKAHSSKGSRKCVSSPLRSEILVFTGEIGNLVPGDLGRTGAK